MQQTGPPTALPTVLTPYCTERSKLILGCHTESIVQRGNFGFKLFLSVNCSKNRLGYSGQGRREGDAGVGTGTAEPSVCGVSKPAAEKAVRHEKNETLRPSLAAQWSGLGTFTAGAQTQSLVGELTSCKTPGMTGKKRVREQCKPWWPPRCSCVLHTSKSLHLPV